ncbi:hypothetical protein AAH678_02025 [Sodalis endosymbiont of Spalangia cameroni]|uniref:hypothetical protein n=1 Tax=Sodalis praecaptivus TaxID=1239307 RepID=UPI0031F98603
MKTQSNRDVFTLLTAPLTGTAQAMSPTDLRIAASAGEMAIVDYLRGIAAIGNLIVWADDNDNYTDHTNDLAALGAFLHHTAQMVNATRVFANHADVMADMREELNGSATAEDAA